MTGVVIIQVGVDMRFFTVMTVRLEPLDTSLDGVVGLYNLIRR